MPISTASSPSSTTRSSIRLERHVAEDRIEHAEFHQQPPSQSWSPGQSLGPPRTDVHRCRAKGWTIDRSGRYGGRQRGADPSPAPRRRSIECDCEQGVRCSGSCSSWRRAVGRPPHPAVVERRRRARLLDHRGQRRSRRSDSRRSSIASPRRPGIEVELVAIGEDQLQAQITAAGAAGHAARRLRRDLARASPIPSPPTARERRRRATAVVDALGRDTFSAERARARDGRRRASSACPATAGRSSSSTARTSSTPQASSRRHVRDDPGRRRRRSTAGDGGHRGRDRPGRLVHPADLRVLRARQRLRGRSTTTAPSCSTSPQCVETFRLLHRPHQERLRRRGVQDADTTRAAYFAGDAAMIVWSSFLLDELAGLRDDALPTCDRVPDGPALPGQQQRRRDRDQRARAGEAVPVRRADRRSSISQDADTEEAAASLRRVHDERRLRRLAGARPRGQVPDSARHGREPDRVRRRLGRRSRPASTRKEPLGEIYPAEVLDALTHEHRHDGPLGLSRRARAALVGAAPRRAAGPEGPRRGARRVELTPEEAAAKAQADVEELVELARVSAALRTNRVAPMTADQATGVGDAPPIDPAPSRRAGPACSSSRRPSIVVMVAVVIPILWTIFIAFQRLRLRDLRRSGIFGAEFTLDNFIAVLHLAGLLRGADGHAHLQRRRDGARHRRWGWSRPSSCARRSAAGRSCAALDAAAVRHARGGRRRSCGRSCSTRTWASSTRSARTCSAGSEAIPFLSQRSGDVDDPRRLDSASRSR